MRDDTPAWRRLGPYILIKRLGIGGMAETWLALRQITTGVHKFVALKFIMPACNDVADFVQLFYHEAGISLNLEHPNIISVWDCCMIDGHHTMVMEYLRGVTLRDVFARMRERNVQMPLEVAAWIGVQMLDALDYLHQRCGDDGKWLQIVHRDVTPDNIFVCYDGLCRLFDFGVARSGSEDNEIQKGMIVGKVAYMSPEQCAGSHVDGRSDTFALAAVLYEMATGIPVFERESDIKTINALMHDTIEAPHKRDYKFSAYLSRIIMQGLERDPERRYATAGDFASDLRNYMKVGGFAQTQTALQRFLATLFAPEIAKNRTFLAQTLESIQAEMPADNIEKLISQSKRITDPYSSAQNRKRLEIAVSRISTLQGADSHLPPLDTCTAPNDDDPVSHDTMEMLKVRN